MSYDVEIAEQADRLAERVNQQAGYYLLVFSIDKYVFLTYHVISNYNSFAEKLGKALEIADDPFL